MRVFFTILIVLGLSLLLLAACSSPPSATRSATYVVDGSEDTGTSWRRSTPSQVVLNVDSLANDGIHDPQNESFPVLQEPAEVLSAFPVDRRGAVNWVKVLDLGIISPRADLLGESQMQVLDMDIMFKDTGAMPWVLFPHDKHTAWLDCTNCHDEIFIPRAGANKITMDAVLAGEFCGRCHGKVSFTLWVCERCHSVPHEGSPAKWW